ncbi:MAG: hypothetical protein ABI345_09525 [Jatrophihabitans sp.]
MDIEPADEPRMNDLAERVVHGLDAVRRGIQARPTISLGTAGFLLSSAVVLAGGQVSANRPTDSLTSWIGLIRARDIASGSTWPAVVLLTAIVLLAGLWLVALEVIRRGRPSSTRVWFLVGAWSTPFALGPPFMDTSVYSYAAYGLVQRAGHSPYDRAPSSLGAAQIVGAIDPAARGVPSSSGPLGSLVQHLSVSVAGGSALGAVIVLRVIGVLAAVAIGRIAIRLAGSGRRTDALALCVLNPLVLLYVISTPHLDGPMIALSMGALLAAARRRWLLAVALAAAAGSVLAPALVVVPAVMVAHCIGRRSMPIWQIVGRDALVAAAVILGSALISTGGFGWVRTVTDQFSIHTPYSVSGLIGKVLTPIVRGASFDDLAASGRITAAAAAAFLVVVVLATARQRPLEQTAGYALLAVAFLAPSLWPWYPLWGLLCLAPTASGIRRTWVMGLSIAACLLAPPGFSAIVTGRVVGVWLVIAGAALATVLVLEHRRAAAAPEQGISARK